MHFASDNTGPAHPRVMEALAAANAGYAMPYGSDAGMEAVRAHLRAVFEAPDAAIYLVATGTAANALILATLGQPWQTIYCTEMAHIEEDECNAPEFFTGGTKLTLIDAPEAKLTAARLQEAIGTGPHAVHHAQPGPVSLTQATEKGTVYSVDEIGAVAEVAHGHGLSVHMDGARFANALVSLGCSPAEMTWKAGVDAVSFGGTKNGLLGVEAAIFFDPHHAWEFELRRKRAAHLFSKHRFLTAQMAAYLADDLWLDMARTANAAAARLARGLRQMPDAALLWDPKANLLFADLPRAAHQRLHAAGAEYYLWSGALEGDDPSAPLTARMVCDWSAQERDVDRFLEILRG